MARVIPLRTAAENREAQLVSRGWAKQTTIGEPRLSELVENYRALGYEVEVVEHRTEGDSCGTCFDAGREMGQTYGDIWLRKKPGARSEPDELF